MFLSTLKSFQMKNHPAIKSKIILLLFSAIIGISLPAQTIQRVAITSITPSENTGMNYSPWLTDNLDTLIKSVWGSNLKYVEVKLKLEQRTLVNHLSLYDYEGVFTTNPAYLYAKAGTVQKLIGVFQGLTYKTFVTLDAADSTIADTIIVYKYGNNIPQKVKVYGTAYTGTVPGDSVIVDTTPTFDSASVVKIPVDTARWYTLTYTSKGMSQLLNGITNESIQTGYSSFLPAYEAVYPLDSGENITLRKIKFYDLYGTFASTPMTLSVINKQGQRIQLATFTGSTYQAWVGPYPDRTITGEAAFWLDSAIGNISYIVISCTGNNLPSEIELYGNYTSPVNITAAPVSAVPLENAAGMNAFEWDFVNQQINYRVVDSAKFHVIKNFRGFRHYLDWYRIEEKKNINVFNRWPYDEIYRHCKEDSIEVLVCLQNIPAWLQQTYPDSLRNNDNNPVPYNYDLLNPASSIDKAKAGFQIAARYGRNTAVPPSFIKIDTLPRWTADIPDTVKIGLNLVKYIECGNEPDKWWKGRKGYMTAYEYAAHLSAFYDGHLNTLGDTVGVKIADSTMLVVAAGIACGDPSYYRGMIEWCRINRGYKPNGAINLCWDVINYHHYSNDAQSSQSGSSTRGAAPEISDAQNTAADFVALANKYANGAPVWITETGFDINQQSVLKAIPIGDKTALQTQADWILRSALVMMRKGLKKVFFYEYRDTDVNNPTKFSSMGLVDSALLRKPAGDFLYQLSRRYGKYIYQQTLSESPVADRYQKDSSSMYALWVPNETGSTSVYELNLGTDSACIAIPVPGQDSMQLQFVATNAGALSLVVAETPIFIEAWGSLVNGTVTQQSGDSVITRISRINEIPADGSQIQMKISPNPTRDRLQILLPVKQRSAAIQIILLSAGTGQVVQEQNWQADGSTFIAELNLNNLAAGMYYVVIQSGKEKWVQKVIKQ
jgi:endoglucanase